MLFSRIRHDVAKINLGGADVTFGSFGNVIHLIRRNGVWYCVGVL